MEKEIPATENNGSKGCDVVSHTKPLFKSRDGQPLQNNNAESDGRNDSHPLERPSINEQSEYLNERIIQARLKGWDSDLKILNAIKENLIACSFFEYAEEAEKIKTANQSKSRCCGRCDGVHDLCVADTICDAHKLMGCEACFGPRIME